MKEQKRLLLPEEEVKRWMLTGKCEKLRGFSDKVAGSCYVAVVRK